MQKFKTGKQLIQSILEKNVERGRRVRKEKYDNDKFRMGQQGFTSTSTLSSFWKGAQSPSTDETKEIDSNNVSICCAQTRDIVEGLRKKTK
jgi:hypothetical protein